MNTIRILPENLANQIAAGEVVERPASVVKELIENSIDAGAGRIRVEIELGGRRLMRITDDGCGMNRDDALLAFERHATSKIKTLEDLGRIATLGFRGEALASIASVARVELTTKTDAAETAVRVAIDGGRLADVREGARTTGTTISVRDLFFNTPARRKFMRSEATENFHLTSIVTHYALAHPEIAFTLSSNGRESLNLAPARDLRERAYQIFGAGLIESLLPVTGGREFVAKVSGFVSAPRERRTTRDAQYFFINGRFVRDRVIAGGLLEGFRSILPHGVYPVAFLFLEIPSEEVDVNVHPAKTEVRFRRSEAVKEVIAEAVRNSLAAGGIAPQRPEPFVPAIREPGAERPHPEQTRIEFTAPNTIERQNAEATIAAVDLETFQAPVVEFDQPNAIRGSSSEIEILKSEFTNHTSEPATAGSLSLLADHAVKAVRVVGVEQVSASKIRPIGQLHESFIIAVDDEGLLLIDQHVAHERILFDKFRKAESDRAVESQNLLIPETFDLTPAQAVAFEIVAGELESCGFEIRRMSGRTVAIKSVPADVATADARNLLAELLETVETEKRGGARATLRDEVAASLACKAAVKINMPLTTEKMQWLIDRLLLTSSPTTCPHGRPVILRLTMKDIERGFHRT
jgi:DNA mismatch repair protein MutL